MKKKIKRKMMIFISGFVLFICIALVPKFMTQAETSEHFKSRGIIRYTDTNGEEVIFDAGDLEMLFQSAAKGKNGILQALGGIGTKFLQQEGKYLYSRYPQTEAEIQILHSTEELKNMSFAVLLEALSDSQKLPKEYADTYSLATSDNLTLGNAAWSDGSLVLGNNHDLLEHYAEGWMEGAGYTSMTPILDESGNVIGYIFT